MEILRSEYGWLIKNTHGAVPKELKGEFTSLGKAEEAIRVFQAKVRASAKNVTELGRKRAARNATISN